MCEVGRGEAIGWWGNGDYPTGNEADGDLPNWTSSELSALYPGHWDEALATRLRENSSSILILLFV